MQVNLHHPASSVVEKPSSAVEKPSYTVRILLLTLFLTSSLYSQIRFQPETLDFGNVSEVSQIDSYLILTNTSKEDIVLLRAETPKAVQALVTRGRISPGDTLHLRLRVNLKDEGNFNETIRIHHSAAEKPQEIKLKGIIKNIPINGLQACVSFNPRDGSFKHQSPIFRTIDPVPGDNPPVEPGSELNIRFYKPNNIVFLIDVSGSMKDPSKLPLLKSAMQNLLRPIRDVDTITVVTYASDIRIMASGIPGSEKHNLEKTINQLQAQGTTQGSKGLQMAYKEAEKHFIPGGSNLIILATDGLFPTSLTDKLLVKRAVKNSLYLSTVTFGNDEKAMAQLRELSNLGQGSSIHITSETDAQNALINEIKMRSARSSLR